MVESFKRRSEDFFNMMLNSQLQIFNTQQKMSPFIFQIHEIPGSIHVDV